jgi:thiamine-monophosphate kinase
MYAWTTASPFVVGAGSGYETYRTRRREDRRREVAITVAEAGEFGLIERIITRLSGSAAIIVGPGDDAAVIRAPDARVVASTDTLIEGRHFRRDWSGPGDIGHRAAAEAMADIAAMGAVPTGVLVGLGCPPDLPVNWVEELVDGMREESGELGAAVVGGDVVRSDTVVLAMTALGDLQRRDPVTRGGARAGEVVAVTGRLGWSAAGLAVLARGFRSPAVVVGAHRRPEPPYAEGPRAAEAGATAMCDISDGLVQDVGHLASASGVGIDLRRDALVVPARLRDVGRALGVDPMDWLLGGGDDHSLVATFPAKSGPPPGWTLIGRVTDPVDGGAVSVDGVRQDPAGFDHFSRG